MNDQRGLIKEILIIIVILIVLGYFGLNVNNIISSATVQANLKWLWNIVLAIWSLIAAPLTWLWNLFLSLLHTAVSNSTH